MNAVQRLAILVAQAKAVKRGLRSTLTVKADDLIALEDLVRLLHGEAQMP